jgi:hypothetical protein
VLGAQDKKKNWVKLTLPQKSMVLWVPLPPSSHWK